MGTDLFFISTEPVEMKNRSVPIKHFHAGFER